MATLDLPTLTDCGCKARVYGDGSGVDIDYCPLHYQAPAMLAMLRGLLAAYEGHYLVPPDEIMGIWADAKKLIRQAEGQRQPDPAADGLEIERLRGIVADYRRETGIRTERARDAVTQLRAACLAAWDRLQATSFDGAPMTGDVVFDQLTKALEDTGGFDPEAQP